MIAIEHVAADHQKDETGKMSRCQEKSWWDALKHLYWYRTKARQTLQGTGCKKMYEGNRVAEREWGKERKDAKNVGCEDVKWTRFYTDTFTHRRSYADTLLHTEAFTHRRFYTQKSLHTDAWTQQSLHKVRGMYFPVLLRTAKLAQALPGTTALHKTLPRTTLYYKGCTRYFPALLCTSVLQSLHKDAQSTSQYYFVLQSLHKVRPYARAIRRLVTHRRQTLLHKKPLYTQTLLHTDTFLHTFTHRKLAESASCTASYYKASKLTQGARGNSNYAARTRRGTRKTQKKTSDYAGGMRGTRKTEMKITSCWWNVSQEFWEENLTLCWQDRHQRTLDAPKITSFPQFLTIEPHFIVVTVAFSWSLVTTAPP